jgi:proteasome lid subunit RPN8/RPN11
MSKAARSKSKAQPSVVMEAEVARQIRQHCRTSMKAEVCGVLIGSINDERTLIEACIAGVNAAQGGAHVTFTQDTWEHIYKIKDKEYPDEKIVGWYHSHPGFGVFLSEHDLFIQENFFSSPQQVAWVFDPHTDEEGCFGWIGGAIEKLSGLRFGYSQNIKVTAAETSEYDEEEQDSETVTRPQSKSQEPVWMVWTSRILGYITALLLGAVLAFFFLRQQMETRAEQEIHRFELQLREEYTQRFQEVVQGLKAQLEAGQLPTSALDNKKTSSPEESKGQKPKKPQPDGAKTEKGQNGKH